MKEYFTDVRNLMEIFQYCNTFWIISVHLAGYEIPSISTQRVLAAITTLLLWLKVLDWLKLFRPTSFFIQLIAETIYGIRYFFMIYLVAIFMFGGDSIKGFMFALIIGVAVGTYSSLFVAYSHLRCLSLIHI